jgi:hypothetical protein
VSVCTFFPIDSRDSLLSSHLEALPPGLGHDKKVCLWQTSARAHHAPLSRSDMAVVETIATKRNIHPDIGAVAQYALYQLGFKQCPNYAEAEARLADALSMFEAQSDDAWRFVSTPWSQHFENRSTKHMYSVVPYKTALVQWHIETQNKPQVPETFTMRCSDVIVAQVKRNG